MKEYFLRKICGDHLDVRRHTITLHYNNNFVFVIATQLTLKSYHATEYKTIFLFRVIENNFLGLHFSLKERSQHFTFFHGKINAIKKISKRCIYEMTQITANIAYASIERSLGY